MSADVILKGRENSCPASLPAQNGKDRPRSSPLLWENYNAAEVFLVRP